jgi:ectoine hydroxylase
MNMKCLDYLISDEERTNFERDGYLIVEDVLNGDQLQQLNEATDRVDSIERANQGLSDQDRLSVMDFVGKDQAFVDLVDWHKTFPKVWGILGWNIQMYHSHLVVTPPQPTAKRTGDRKLGWHQDSDRLNYEMETTPRPRISIKVAFFLSDCSKPDRGNFLVVPGSHLKDSIDLPDNDRKQEFPEGVPVLAPQGSAVFFDRRIWHSASANFWDQARKVLFYGYSYRWLRPRDAVTVNAFWDELDPIRKQLFGASATGAYGYTSPTDDDVPLRSWINANVGAHAVMP